MSRFIQLWLVLGLLLTTASPAPAQPTEGDFAEELVRAQYVEGLPYFEARELTPAGVERLIEMLRDPAKAEHHENIVMALGISGEALAYPALVEFQNREGEGEEGQGRTTLAARNAVPCGSSSSIRTGR